MVHLPPGKGFYVWQILACENGDPGQIAAMARIANLGHVLIKVANAHYAYNIGVGNIDLVPPVVAALEAADVEAWGWQYVYGVNPLAEADIALARIRQLNLKGFVVNAEVEYKQPGKRTAAVAYMSRLRSGVGNSFPIALSSYRYPSYHPEFPWREFLERVDINMPQVYWMQATNAGAQLRRTLDEFARLSPQRPIVPTGAAFAEWGWTATTSQITEFLDTAQALKLPAVNFWSWQHARAKLQLWEAVADYAWPFPAPPVPAPDPEVDMLIVKQDLNLRTGQSTTYPIITLMPAGERVELLEVGILSGGYPWLKVRVPRTGKIGWCASVISGIPRVQVV